MLPCAINQPITKKTPADQQCLLSRTGPGGGGRHSFRFFACYVKRFTVPTFMKFPARVH